MRRFVELQQVGEGGFPFYARDPLANVFSAGQSGKRREKGGQNYGDSIRKFMRQLAGSSGCAEEICPPDNRIELHIRKCTSETRYSAIFKSCFPPHNAEFDDCWPGLVSGLVVSRYRAIERATCQAQQNFTASLTSFNALHVPVFPRYLPPTFPLIARV